MVKRDERMVNGQKSSKLEQIKGGTMNYNWESAKICHVDVGFEDHGILTLFATFDYGGSIQGLGYAVNSDFIRGFLQACSATRLQECVGRVVMVYHSDSKIIGIKPMPFDEGKEFDIEDWATRLKS